MVLKAIAEDDSECVAIEVCVIGFGVEEIQLLYQIALHGRQDIGFAFDDYVGFMMALMRMLAFMPEGNTPQLGRSETAASKVLAYVPMLQDSKKKSFDIDWNAFVRELLLVGMERMLAYNCQLIAWWDERIELCVSHVQRHLVECAYQDRLKLVLEQHLGTRV